jgi:hypothetical protein
MTRGNWQRRVELNEARRHEAKQKKQRNEEKKLWKAQAQAFLSILDRNAKSIMNYHRRRHRNNNNNIAQPNSSSSSSSPSPSSIIVHIYTDTLPSDSPPVLDLWEEEVQHGGKQSNRRTRARSISIENEKAVTAGSKTPNSGKKKSHPRSKDSNADEAGDGDDGESTLVAPKLCRSFFFCGKCHSTGGGKKGGGKRPPDCRYVHYPKRYNSLCTVLSTSRQGNDALSASETAYSDSVMTTTGVTKDDDSSRTGGSMDMIYYFSLDLNEFAASDKDGGGSNAQPMSVWLTDAMAQRNCNLGSLVYVTLDDKLVFDRYRQGTVVQDEDFNYRAAMAGSTAGTDQDHSTSSDEHAMAKSMPASVLEYVLQFLGDPAVAAMSSVCKDWNHEIGKQSGDLWKNLLKRRNWPLPLSSTRDCTGCAGTTNAKAESVELRSAFVSHYRAVRICRAIKSGIDILTCSKRSPHNDHSEFCIRSFESVENAPQEGNYCVSVKIFAPNRFLVAYRDDCTLRLFDSTERSGGNGGGRLCRELVCYCIDPYRNTKRRHCKIVAVSLDEQCVGCLLQVTDDGSGAEASVLAVVSRDALLIADDPMDSNSTQIIDINQSILNYLLSYEEADHGLLQLMDFFSDGGDLDDVEVLVSKCIESCGYGRFLVEVSISIPIGDATDDDNSETRMTMLFRKLFLFSSSVEAIIWMCDSNAPTRPIRPRHDDMTLATAKMEENGRRGCNIISVSSFSPGIMGGSVDPSGEFIDPLLIENSNSLRDVDQQDGWNLRGARLRAVVIIGQVIVMADNLVHTEDNSDTYKCILRFYPLAHDTAVMENAASLTIDENIAIRTLIRLDDKHVMAIGVQTAFAPSETNELEDVDGQWFGNQEDDHDAVRARENVGLVSIIVDVESRLEIFRTIFANYNQFSDGDHDFFNEGDVPLQIDADGDTVAAGVWWKGVVMTGADTRQEHPVLMKIDTSNESAKSKKKKKGPKKAGKKDGFARGMSLRG